jgi:hypothetical protein
MLRMTKETFRLPSSAWCLPFPAGSFTLPWMWKNGWGLFKVPQRMADPESGTESWFPYRSVSYC